ncbi:hypothetical protein OPV22_004052 [Ensete ventricosum]|uniref:Uncharacterized protein n=1 Tax=Ensete ventricosum TaxID=4639 RepID=A0AAV8S2B2_ENSVE|nr:hypothetical protein OPV22_004052 [Ensete ventricosum]
MAVVAASSLVEKAVASDAPSPGPSSGAAATLAAPAAVLASLAALVVGYFFDGCIMYALIWCFSRRDFLSC